jgi:hypothetical protein
VIPDSKLAKVEAVSKVVVAVVSKVVVAVVSKAEEAAAVSKVVVVGNVKVAGEGNRAVASAPMTKKAVVSVVDKVDSKVAGVKKEVDSGELAVC